MHYTCAITLSHQQNCDRNITATSKPRIAIQTLVPACCWCGLNATMANASMSLVVLAFIDRGIALHHHWEARNIHVEGLPLP